MTSDECSSKSGTISGKCASGFGACCKFTYVQILNSFKSRKDKNVCLNFWNHPFFLQVNCMWWNCFSGNFTLHFLTAIMKINFVVIFRFHESKQKHPTVYKLSHLYLNTLESQSTFIHFQDFFPVCMSYLGNVNYWNCHACLSIFGLFSPAVCLMGIVVFSGHYSSDLLYWHIF